MKKFVLVAVLLFAMTQMQAQVDKNNPYWVFPPEYIQVDKDEAPSASSIPMNGTPDTKANASNAIFDKDGELIFAVNQKLVSTTPHLYVYDRYGNETALTGVSPAYGYGEQFEIPIIPVPDVCNQYFIVHRGFNLISWCISALIGPIYYCRIEYDPGTHEVTVLSIENSINVGGSILHVPIYNSVGMAVSKTKDFTSYRERYLYIVGPTFDGSGAYPWCPWNATNLLQCTVSSAGISCDRLNYTAGNVFFGGPSWNTDYFTSEADLSDDGNYLFWGNNFSGGKLWRYDIGGTTLEDYDDGLTQGNISGVEFYDDGSDGVLFYSIDGSTSNDGIYFVEESTDEGSDITFVSGSSSFYRTHIERAIDGYYYVSDGSELKGFDPASPTLSGGGVPTLTISNPLVGGVYTLVDQLDGENYLNSPILPVCDPPYDIGYTAGTSNTTGTGAIPRKTEVSNKITADAASSDIVVVDNSTVFFKAGYHVQIKPGFVAEEGSRFRAWIGDCSFAASCTLTSNRIAVQVSNHTKGGSEAAPTRLNIYPNPNQGLFTIDLGGGEEERVSVTVTDATGRVVYQGELNMGTGKLEMALPQPPGVYYMKVVKPNGEAVMQPIVIQK